MIELSDLTPHGTIIRPLLVRLVEENNLFGTEFWAAVVGAVVGGAIALAGQAYAHRHARITRDAEKKERDATHGRLALFKVLRIQSSLHAMKSHLREGAAAAKDHGLDLWSAVLPLATVADRVEFSPEELHVVAMLGDPKLFDMFQSLDQFHNMFAPLWETYGRERTELLTKLVPEDFKDGVGTGEVDAEEMKKLSPQIYQLSNLLDQMSTLVGQAFVEASEVLKQLVEAINTRYELELKIEPKGEV